MTYPQYLDFDLELTAEGAMYTARVLASPKGEAEAHVTMPFDDDRLENVVLKLGRTRTGVRRLGSPQQALAKQFGASLYDAVFSGEVGTCFRRSLDEADRQGKGLRLRLRLTDAPALCNVPWEYLYPEGVGHFLVLSQKTPVIRYLDLPREVAPLAVQPPIRVLLVVSGPSDLAVLDTATEMTNMQTALAALLERGLVKLDILPEPSLAALRRALRTSTYHVLHFIGHGGYDEVNGDGVIAFEDENGRSHQVSGGDLGTMLHDHSTLRLAVLNACEGARTSPKDPFSGVAQALVQQGLPAVVAMQFEITDDAAIGLSQEFYSALSDGYPVDAALAEGRKAVFGNDNDVEWGTPVLYLRASDGRIFDVSPSMLLPPVETEAPPAPAPTPSTPPTPPTPTAPTPAPASETKPSPAAPAPAAAASTVPADWFRAPEKPADKAPGGAADGPSTGTAAAAGLGAAALGAHAGGAAVSQPPAAPPAPPKRRASDRQPGPPAPPAQTAPARTDGTPPGGTVYTSQQTSGGGPPGQGEKPKMLPVVLVVGAITFVVILIALAIGFGLNLGGSTGAQTPPSQFPTDPPVSQPVTSPPSGSLPEGVSFAALPGSPTIDGSFDDWSSDVTAASDQVVAPDQLVGTAPAVVGAWQVRWDQNALYVLALVTDTQITPADINEASGMWRGDGVSLELGKDAGGRDPSRNARPTDAHFIFGIGSDGRLLNCVNRAGANGGFPGGQPEGSIQGAVSLNGTYYILEAAIPWSLTDVTPTAGTVVSVNFNVSTADPSTGELAEMVSSNPQRFAGNQQHPGLWQRMVLG